MSSPLDALTAKDIILVKAFAEGNMRIANVAIETGLNESTIRRRLSSIYKKSRLDPRRFYDLRKLIACIESGEQ